MKSKKHPSEEAFLTNPVASATDRTGFAVTVPQTQFNAEELSDMFGDIPITQHLSTSDDGIKHDSKHCKCSKKQRK